MRYFFGLLLFHREKIIIQHLNRKDNQRYEEQKQEEIIVVVAKEKKIWINSLLVWDQSYEFNSFDILIKR
jgi:hypothetical protein